MRDLTAEDLDLIAVARRAIAARYRPDWHVVGAALRTRAGRVFTGVHLEANVGRIAVCAEAVALGRAATEAGDTDVDTIVAVYHPAAGEPDQTPQVVAPCGMCRELIADYAAEARVLVPGADGSLEARPIAALIPGKYTRP
ncbi:MAG TPA: cytidine deaminase [Gemmatimonadaceae bacterium]|nr:cytidine deaminase [Gemmatimonadaceae bacterium]